MATFENATKRKLSFLSDTIMKDIRKAELGRLQLSDEDPKVILDHGDLTDNSKKNILMKRMKVLKKKRKTEHHCATYGL